MFVKEHVFPLYFLCMAVVVMTSLAHCSQNTRQLLDRLFEHICLNVAYYHAPLSPLTQYTLSASKTNSKLITS